MTAGVAKLRTAAWHVRAKPAFLRAELARERADFRLLQAGTKLLPAKAAEAHSEIRREAEEIIGKPGRVEQVRWKPGKQHRATNYYTLGFLLTAAQLIGSLSRPSGAMRNSHSELLSHLQVARLEARRKSLGLTRAVLLDRFEAALREAGCVHTAAAAKMRLDRVFNPRMRRPISESTKAALARALGWNLRQLENALALACDQPVNGGETAVPDDPRSAIKNLARDLMMTARTLQANARKLESLAAKNQNGARKKRDEPNDAS